MVLQNVEGWHDEVSCVPTVLCSVFAIKPKEVGALLSTASFLVDLALPPTIQPEYPVPCWMAAIELLGWKAVKKSDHRDKRYAELDTIETYMASHDKEGLRLILCFREEGPNGQKEVGHLFAAENGNFVDCETGGQVQKFTTTPDNLGGFRVRCTFELVRLAR